MNKGLAAAALLLLVLAAAFWLQPPAPPPDVVEEGGMAGLARIQAALAAAAEGKATTEPAAEALRAILAGDLAEADRLLDEIEAEIEHHLPTESQMLADPGQAGREEWLVSYFELLPEAEDADPQVRGFNRLAVVLRKTDALLLAEALADLRGYDLVSRRSAQPSALDGAGLRLPCRLTRTHPALTEGAGRFLGKLADRRTAPLTDCP
ncbi:hypothetical protein [Magnetospirillum sp. SS-4]|uniref:hypothetical protein n=1 Tax=Magnetospirillum sp. SS-4 TaxID=2681465 RepID=UPI0013816B49|nr:hypothetical protein [Magnetospirillum sp. SS-4]CAA7626788.1 Outer membrane protein H.8 (modular protein) [Magnetospirillum sp. SS-4]